MWFGWDAYCGLWSRCVLDAVQFVLALWGIYEWKKLDAQRSENVAVEEILNV